MSLYTFYDAVDHLSDFMGLATVGSSVRDAKRAAIQSLRELVNAHPWRYLIKEHFVRTNAYYNTGTIGYDHTGGSSERLVTLDSGVWPDWIAQGKVLINSTHPAYDVHERLSDTTITLSVNSNPGEDVASSTTYQAFQDSYPLPMNFVKMQSNLYDAENRYTIPYVSPGQWLSRTTLYNTPSEVFEYTIKPSENYQGVDEIAMSPPPSTSKAYQFLYHRRPRDLRIYEYATGAVATSAASATVTLTNGTFSQSHVGSVIRISDNSSNLPSSYEGDHPYAIERVITAVASGGATATMDAVAGTTYSGVKYRVSDPVDIHAGVMLNAYLRLAEKNLANLRVQDKKNDYSRIAMMELLSAIESDNRGGEAMTGSASMRIGITESILERGTLAE